MPVYHECDVLVVGGGPSGSAAAYAAAKAGADVVLLERYNHLGGLSTGGLVIWIDRMTDWTGRQVIRGFADEILDGYFNVFKSDVCCTTRPDTLTIHLSC